MELKNKRNKTKDKRKWGKRFFVVIYLPFKMRILNTKNIK